jgi:glycosyltransferase involved in cell wall biosynthesis
LYYHNEAAKVSSLPSVEVLLATYNGSRYIREQIDSILGQDFPNLTILARDDGSTDGTRDLLFHYAEHLPGRFKMLPASTTNGGILGNFLALMKASTADYICFADQDDVWLPDKVRKTKETMDRLESTAGSSTPLLVFSDLRVVDENLAVLYPSFWAHMGIDPERVHHFNKLVVRGVVTGCTMMVNRALLKLSLRIPSDSRLHDRWIALLASTMGSAAVLRDQTILYRQHDRNAVGTGEERHPPPFFDRLRPHSRKTRADIEEWKRSQQLASLLLEVHGTDLSAGQRELVLAFRRCQTSPNRIVRVGSLLRHRFYCGTFASTLAVLSYLWSVHPAGEN